VVTRLPFRLSGRDWETQFARLLSSGHTKALASLKAKFLV